MHLCTNHIIFNDRLGLRIKETIWRIEKKLYICRYKNILLHPFHSYKIQLITIYILPYNLYTKKNEKKLFLISIILALVSVANVSAQDYIKTNSIVNPDHGIRHQGERWASSIIIRYSDEQYSITSVNSPMPIVKIITSSQ